MELKVNLLLKTSAKEWRYKFFTSYLQLITNCKGTPTFKTKLSLILFRLCNASLRTGNRRVTIRKSKNSIRRYTVWLTNYFNTFPIFYSSWWSSLRNCPVKYHHLHNQKSKAHLLHQLSQLISIQNFEQLLHSQW